MRLGQRFCTILAASLAMLCLALAGCGSSSPAENRAARAEHATGPVRIGAIAPWTLMPGMWNGVELAVRQINDNGGLLGRPLEVVREVEPHDTPIESTLRLPQRFVDDEDIVAVIGHYYTYLTRSAAIMYQHHGVLMCSMVPTWTTQEGFNLVAKTVAKNEEYGSRIVNFCKDHGLRKAAIVVEDSPYSRDMAAHIELSAARRRLPVAARLQFANAELRPLKDSYWADLREDVKEWLDKNRGCDVIIVAARTEGTRRVLRTLEEIDWDKPVIAGNLLDRPDFLERARTSGLRLYWPTTFNPRAPSERMEKFIADYQVAYKQPPSVSAVQGYDTIGFYAFAVRKANSASPPKVAQAMRDFVYPGVMGDYDLNNEGALESLRIWMMGSENGTISYE